MVSDDGVRNVDGLWWYKAPIPRRFHRCFSQTRGFVGLNYYERCPCGGIRINSGRWMERNSRRKGK